MVPRWVLSVQWGCVAAENHWTWEVAEGFSFALSTTLFDPMPLLCAHITTIDSLGKAGTRLEKSKRC